VKYRTTIIKCNTRKLTRPNISRNITLVAVGNVARDCALFICLSHIQWFVWQCVLIFRSKNKINAFQCNQGTRAPIECMIRAYVIIKWSCFTVCIQSHTKVSCRCRVFLQNSRFGRNGHLTVAFNIWWTPIIMISTHFLEPFFFELLFCVCSCVCGPSSSTT